MEAVVEARKEYMQVIYECMIPELMETFLRMYEDTTELFRGDKGRLQRFKEISSEIQGWDDGKIDVHLENIKAECPWFEKVIEASIVSLVQIMNSVKINKLTNKITLNIPTASEFLRKSYKTSQAYICKAPEFLVDDNVREQVLAQKISKSIDSVIRSYVPLQNMLSINISNHEEPVPEEPEELEEEEEEVIQESPTKEIGISEDDILMRDAAE
jgi:hypothetical protein